jgi:hypothetical protein
MKYTMHPPETIAAVLADYTAGMSSITAATKHGVSPSTARGWIHRAGISRGIALTGGVWVICQRRRIQVWQPFIAPSKQGMTDHERRIEWEDAMFDDDEARDLHARYFNGCREPRTILGERVYNRRKKRERYAKKVAA